MQQRKTEIYRVEREQRKLPVIYDKVSFSLSREELDTFPAHSLFSLETPPGPKTICEAICRVRYDISGME